MVPFLLLAEPTRPSLLWGAAPTLAGLWLRAAAASVIRKKVELARAGPYRYIRHPLYAGTLLAGLGLATAGGGWAWPALFLTYFLAVFPAVAAAEERELAESFGEEHESYRRSVPALLPRPGAALERGSGEGRGLARYMENREWQAALGAAALYALLAAKHLSAAAR